MELNFFKPFLNTKKVKTKTGKSFLPTLLVLLLLLAMIGYAVYSITSIKLLEQTIATHEQQLNEPKFLKQVKEAEEKENEIRNIQAERAFLEKVDTGVSDIDTVTRNLLNLIAGNVTHDLYLTKIEVNLNEISLLGKSKSKVNIAQFEYNIRNSGLFDNIYVDSISLEDETKAYDFNIKFTAKKEAYQGKVEKATTEKKDGN